MAVWQQWLTAEKKAYIGTEAPAKDKEFLQYFAKKVLKSVTGRIYPMTFLLS